MNNRWLLTAIVILAYFILAYVATDYCFWTTIMGIFLFFIWADKDKDAKGKKEKT